MSEHPGASGDDAPAEPTRAPASSPEATLATWGVGDQWLSLVVPAEARRFEVSSPTLSATLADAGAELVEHGAEVQIVDLGMACVTSADVAIVEIAPRTCEAHDRSLARFAYRAAASLGSGVKAHRTAGSLARRGYHVAQLRWDLAHALPTEVAGLRGIAARRRLAEHLPRRAVVVGRREPDLEPSALGAVIARARTAVASFEPRAAWIRSGFVLVTTEQSVLRAAMGPARRQLVGNDRALRILHEAGADPRVTRLLPAVVASGREGLADWALESRMPGERVNIGPLDSRLSAGIVDFLVTLFETPGADDPRRSFAWAGETLALVCRADLIDRARALARRLDAALADVPRGFAHGDFFGGNLLARGGELTGVIDWDSGGPGRLPLTDLLHFRLHAEDPPTDVHWGRAVVERLLPWAEVGGDAQATAYLKRVGLPVADARVHVELVLAYWLERAAYQLSTHPIRHRQPHWIAANVDDVLEVATARR